MQLLRRDAGRSVSRRACGGLARVVVTLLLAVGASPPAHAYFYPGNGGWCVGPRYVDDFSICADAWSRALDGVDIYDEPAYVSNCGWTGGSYRVAGTGGWDGSTGFYYSEARAPLLPGETKAWMLYVWAVHGSASAELVLDWETLRYNDPSVSSRLECVQVPQGVVGAPAVGAVWTSPPTFTLPYYATANGLEGYGFRFTLSMVPEPSSLVALTAFLAPVAGLALRRRK